MRLRDFILDVLESMNTPRTGVGSYGQQKARKTIQKIREEHEHDNSWLFNGGTPSPEFEDSYESRHRQALSDQLEFDLMVLLYAMNEDDGIVTKDETEYITEHILAYKDRITEKDRKAIRKRLPKRPSLDQLVYFVQDHQMSETDVSESLHILKELNNHTNQYSNAMYHIESIMKSQLDYFN